MKLKSLLKIIFKLIKKTRKLEQKQTFFLQELLFEKSHSFGLKIYSEPINQLIDDLDNYFDQFIEKNKEEDVYYGGILEYIIYETDFLKENKTTEFVIKVGERRYDLSKEEDTYDFLLEEVIENTIKKSNNIAEKDIEKRILEILIEFMINTIDLSNEFSKNIAKYCNPVFCNESTLRENYPAIKNIEENVQKEIEELYEIESDYIDKIYFKDKITKEDVKNIVKEIVNYHHL